MNAEQTAGRGERIFTIGHSTHPIDKFVAFLDAHHIDAIADVRSMPYSRRSPQFNREGFAQALAAVGRTYVFLGQELGARPEDRSCYLDGKVQFEILGQAPLFRRGIERVCRGSREHRIALMCAEKEPLVCHRTILVSRHLVAAGLLVDHILGTGLLESHPDAMSRLLSELGMLGHDLFKSREELETEAYQRRGEEIAYTEE